MYLLYNITRAQLYVYIHIYVLYTVYTYAYIHLRSNLSDENTYFEHVTFETSSNK